MGYLTRSFLDSLNRQGWMQQSLYRGAASELGLSENAFWVLYILSDTERQYTQQALCSEWRFSKQTVKRAHRSMSAYVFAPGQLETWCFRSSFPAHHGREFP